MGVDQAIVVLTKEYIKSGTQIRDIIKESFLKNDLPYLKPQSFRHSITRKVRKEEAATDKLIALAENFGQKNGMAVLITSYGGDALGGRAKIIKSIHLE